MKLSQWVDQLVSELPLGEAIDIVSKRMRTASEEEEHTLASELASLLPTAGRYLEALQLLNEMIVRYPDEVRPSISKAMLYLYYIKDAEEALRCINLALKRAYRTLSFRRDALGVKARILLQLRRGEELSDVLEEIISLRIVKNIPDVGRERDFVDRAPPGLIRKNVLARYNQFRPKRATDSMADEPPEYEPPTDEE